MPSDNSFVTIFQTVLECITNTGLYILSPTWSYCVYAISFRRRPIETAEGQNLNETQRSDLSDQQVM